MIGAFLVAVAVAATIPATDGDYAEWHLEKRRRSCFIEAASDRDTYLKIEQDAYRPITYMSVSATAWSTITDQQLYRIGISRDGMPRQEMMATGVRDGDNPRTIVVFTLPPRDPYGRRPAFIDDLRKARTLRLDLGGGQPLAIDTLGLRAALVKLQSCATDINQARHP